MDRDKCARWNLNVSDVQAVVDTAVGGKAFSQMIEGERSFDITLRYPRALRSNLDAILDIPIEVSKNTVVNSQSNGQGDTPVSGPTTGISPTGTSAAQPPLTGSSSNAPMNDLSRTPRRPLRDLVTPLGPDGRLDEHGSFLQRGASDIYRERGERMIVVKFDIDNVDLAGAVAKAKEATKDLVHAPCRLSWGGEFQEMEQAEARMRIVIPVAVALVAVLLYLAFGSLVDVMIVLTNVVALGCGGVWALLLTQTNFSISAAVGFISIFGVAIMDGLLLVSSFHRLRLQGKPVHEAIVEGSMLRTRSILMTGFTAIFGLLPAALSTRIGAGPAPAGHRRHRRHAAGALSAPLPDPGSLQPLPPAAAQSGGRRADRLRTRCQGCALRRLNGWPCEPNDVVRPADWSESRRSPIMS